LNNVFLHFLALSCGRINSAARKSKKMQNASDQIYYSHVTHSHKPIFFAHANGFPGGSYSPLFEALKPYEASYVDSISEDIEEVQPRLKPLAAKLEKVIEQRFDQPIIGMGHSLGAILMFFVAIERPELFQHVVLMDPPFFRPAKRLLVSNVRKVGLGNIVPVAAKAAKRRYEFDSPEEAEAYYSERGLFKFTHPETVPLYVRHGLIRDESSWKLRIPPDFERAVYLNLPYKLDYHRLQVPSSFLYGNRHDVLSKADIRWLKGTFTSTQFIEVEGSHMFPLERPGLVAEVLKGILG
jgi:pimeloyl-ACP methyl ester carboxylesterase